MSHHQYIKQALNEVFKEKNNKSYPVIGYFSNEDKFEEELIRKLSPKLKSSNHHIINKYSIDYSVPYNDCGEAKDIQWEKCSNDLKDNIHPDITILQTDSARSKVIIENKSIKCFFYKNPTEKKWNNKWVKEKNFNYIYSSTPMDTYEYSPEQNKYPKNNMDLDTSPIFKVNEDMFYTFFHEGQIWHDIIRLSLIHSNCSSQIDENIEYYLAGSVQKSPVAEDITKEYFKHKLIKILEPINSGDITKTFTMYSDATVRSYTSNLNEVFKEIECDNEISLYENDQALGYLIKISTK